MRLKQVKTPAIKGEKVTKRTNRKQNFKKFIESEYADVNLFLSACKNDENLLIYTCLTKDELQEYINTLKNLPTIDDQIKYLVNNQPAMNATLERYNRCVESIAGHLKNYIQYNGFKMANSDGDYSDWTSEFWLKYSKICEFYRIRWFYPEKLKKVSTVSYYPMLYKEFIYICRMSITGERKHQAFLATQRPDSSIFKTSLDYKLDSGNNAKTLIDIVEDEYNTSDRSSSSANYNYIINKALELSKQYENGKYTKNLVKFYEMQDTAGLDKKTIILGKIFLYKAGLLSPKVLMFIKSLSNTYKAKFNISQDLVNAQLANLKKNKVFRLPKEEDIYENPDSYVTYMLLKRG